ncbi:N-acetyltransferase [Calothrix sp. PCC 7507]|uniref:GNAT family N-acetyltransferase n=1 Tax=Calothrix sp. PCC 7507 TaxID=99598 RepID=UPI0002DFAD73|nr:GNAT family N-acetyltransferase [Calothrix sp. PCC 7507]
MENLTISVEDNPDPKEIRAVISQILEYNNNHQKQEDVAYPLVILIRNTKGEIFGGLVGETHWGWLFVSHLWVAEALRGQRYGTQLMLKAEHEAKQRGCSHVYLDTFSFQALGFYESLGYQKFGILKDYPPGHQRYFLQKEI